MFKQATHLSLMISTLNMFPKCSSTEPFSELSPIISSEYLWEISLFTYSHLISVSRQRLYEIVLDE